MSKKAFEFTHEEKKQIRADVEEHGSFERAAREWDTTERVINLIWGGQTL